MPPSQNYVFISGATSGIGASTACFALDAGFHVIAGCYPDLAAGRELKERDPDRVTLVALDVTSSESINDAVAKIAHLTGGRGLRGLVNSAGIALLSPAELITVEEFRQVLSINLIGLFALTRELLPLLRQGGGTVVNISSDAGLLAMPTGAAYCSSKFGVEALSDVFRAETIGQGVQFAVVEPGNIDTPIWEMLHRPVRKKYEALTPEQHRLYGDYLESLLATERQGIPVERVARVILSALQSRRPRTRYRVGPDAHLSWLVAKLPARMRDALANRIVKSYATCQSS